MPYKDPEKEKAFQKEYVQSGRSAEAVRRWRRNPENVAKERQHYLKVRYGKNRELFLAQRRLRKYGITKEEYDLKIIFQNNSCAICFKQMVPPHIDHNHATGKNRELLCKHCNTLLGMAFESQEILQGAIRYLQKHSVQSS